MIIYYHVVVVLVWLNTVVKQFMQTHWNGCCCLCLTAALAPNTSMFDVASWMLCVYVWCCSSCACARWLLSHAFAQEISLVDLVFVGLVTNYYNVYVDVCSWLVRLCLTRSKCAWLCCLRRHHTTQWEYVFSRTRPCRSTLVVRCCL